MRLQFILAVFMAFTVSVFWTVDAATETITVYKTPTCGCCSVWIEHLRKNGFKVVLNDVPSTAEYQRKFGVPNGLESCHTAIVAGYTIEGHVPAAEIQRLLKERPKAKGIAVPGMPIGSPGMEMGTRSQRYSVLLFQADGKSSVYKEYPAQY